MLVGLVVNCEKRTKSDERALKRVVGMARGIMFHRVMYQAIVNSQVDEF